MKQSINRERLKKTGLPILINKLEQCESSTVNEKCKIIDEINDVLDKIIKQQINNDEFILNDILYCVDWLINLSTMQSIPNSVKNNQLRHLFNAVIQLMNFSTGKTEVCFALKILSKMISICDAYMVDSKFLMELLRENNELLFSLVDYMNVNSSLEEITTTMQCYVIILNSLSTFDQLNVKQISMCNTLGEKILKLFYLNHIAQFKASEKCVMDFYLSGLDLLRKIIAIDHDFSITYTSELLGITKSFLNFGIDENFLALAPQRVTISQQYTYNSLEEIDGSTDSDKYNNNFGKKCSKNHKLRALEKSINDRNNNVLRNFSTPSEMMDNSTINDVMKSIECSLAAKIRLISIELIGIVCRNLSRRILYGYWHVLFPTETNMCGKPKNQLLYISQCDPSIRCRCAALQVCCQLLYGSKGFMLQAEFNEKFCPTSFTPFSINLGHMIKATYKSLINIINTEMSIAVLIQALKCLAVLIQATTLDKIGKEFLQEIVRDVKPFIYNRDVAIQVSTLMIMEFILTSLEMVNDVVEVLYLSLDTEVNTGMNWLLERICFNLEKQSRITSIRIESLQVLNGLTNHIVLLEPHISVISELLQKCLNDSKSDVRLYSSRCIEAIAFQINQVAMNEKEEMQMKNEIQDELKIVKQYDRFWLFIVNKIINHLNQYTNEGTTTKICLVDALSNIGPIMFERLADSMQIKLLAFLTGLSSERVEDALVRAACIRALAVYATYPSLSNDLIFLENTIELTFSLVTDSNVAVRIKIFWSLGNVSDVLANGNVTDAFCQSRISNELLYRLINVSIKACNDCDKVRCNAVRMLGNLLRLLYEHHFTTQLAKHSTVLNYSEPLNWHQTFQNAIIKLSDCLRSSGNAKVKWNTCYALSNLFRNPVIYNIKEFDWQEIVYPTLCHVLTNHSNFKVRTNASIAIRNIDQRNYFGNYYENFWSSLLEALEQTNNLNNYLEYNHRDALHEQLCLTISHLLYCSSADDYIMLKSHLVRYLDTIRTIWLRVISHMVPEKAEKLLFCSIMLKKRNMLTQNTLNKEQKKSVTFLMEYFQVE